MMSSFDMTAWWLLFMTLFPFAAFLTLAISGGSLRRTVATIIGVAAPALSTLAASVTAIRFIAYPPDGYVYRVTLWEWIPLGAFNPSVSLYLDPLSLVMVLIVTWVGFLIILYSAGFMAEDRGVSRFFACMNLFMGSMLILVLAGDFLVLYLGWEAVGLCSYLLIGFWYEKEENTRAAFKAFVVTRIGDAAMAVGLILLFQSLGTLDIREAAIRASGQWAPGSSMAIAFAALLLLGALGKSAQLPLQTWLPDAMAGPTPVSALIHAATMVTAGVYLVARAHPFFTLAPVVQHGIAVIGGATLIVAASSALVQRDIKRVLAYSTMSQIGYMFLALGVGAWIAAIFHLMVHAFFKALLFLSAGTIIQALDDEHDIARMGGLRKELPLAFLTFLIGSASLSAVPVVTAGSYSKDMILAQVWSSSYGGSLLFFVGLAGAFLTSLYSFRLFFRLFYGEAEKTATRKPGAVMAIPLVILSGLSLIGGSVETPAGLGGVTLFSGFMGRCLPSFTSTSTPAMDTLAMALSSAVSLGGIYLAYLMFLRGRVPGIRTATTAFGAEVHEFFFSGWGFDRLYTTFLVQPFLRAARFTRDDLPDEIYRALAHLIATMHYALAVTQSGNVRLYVTALVLGAILFIGMVILL